MEVDPSQLSDEEIVQKIVSEKDSELFRILYVRYAEKVYHKCIGFTKDAAAAEDLAHDILLKTFLSLGKFNFNSKFSTWLYSLTYNYCVDFKRKEERAVRNQMEYAQEEQAVIDEPSDQEIIAIKVAQLKKLLDEINPEDKALLLMKYQDEFSIKNEIMEITQLSESAIKMRLKRAKEKIVAMSKGMKLEV